MAAWLEWRDGDGDACGPIRQCLRAGTRRRGAVLPGRGGGGGKQMVRRSGGEMGDWIGWLGVWGRALYKLEGRSRGRRLDTFH